MKDNGYRIFKGLDDQTVDRISEKYPVLTDRDREQLFSKSEKKYNKEAEMGINNVKPRKIVDDGDEVSGVDRYTGHMWRRYAATAAAIVLLAGGIIGSILLAKNMNKQSDDNDIVGEMQGTQVTVTSDDIMVTETASTAIIETSAATTTETINEESTEELIAGDGQGQADTDAGQATFALSEEEALEAAKEVFSGYKDAHDIYRGIGVEYDKDEYVAFSFPSSGGYAYVYYNMVINSRFSNTDEIRSYLRTKYSDEWVEEVIGEDISKYEHAHKFSEEDDDTSDGLGLYAMRNGELYICSLCGAGGRRPYTAHIYEYSGIILKHDPEVIAVKVCSDNEIKVKVDDETAENEAHGKKAVSYTLERDSEGKWKITGYSPEF